MNRFYLEVSSEIERLKDCIAQTEDTKVKEHYQEILDKLYVLRVLLLKRL